MLNQLGSRTSCVLVVFAPEVKITLDALKKAIYGGIKNSPLIEATPEQREEIFSETCYRLVNYFAKGNRPRHSVSSIAYVIARRAAADACRRRDKYETLRKTSVENADTELRAGFDTPVETGEDHLVRASEVATRERLLKTAVTRLTAADRNRLVAMLARSEPLSRDTAAALRVANATAQAEKRARDRLRNSVNKARFELEP